MDSAGTLDQLRRVGQRRKGYACKVFSEAILSSTIGWWRVCCPAFSDKPFSLVPILYPGTDRPIKGVKSFANAAELSRAEEK